jgi:hypothetical protein
VNVTKQQNTVILLHWTIDYDRILLYTRHIERQNYVIVLTNKLTIIHISVLVNILHIERRNFMPKHPLTPFGVEIKTKLISIDQTQEWLISQVREKTGMYVDCSNIYRLMRGTLKSSKIETAIKEVLHIQV